MKKILIIGCGDIALRVAKLQNKRYQFFGLIRDNAQRQSLRDAGIHPIYGNLDQPRSLQKIAGLADIVLHFAPPLQITAIKISAPVIYSPHYRLNDCRSV